MRPVVIVHYDEIGTKGRNRGEFEQQLRLALKEVARATAPAEVRRARGRVLVYPQAPEARPELMERMARVPGVRYVLGGLEVPGEDLETLEAAVDAVLPDRDIRTFGVRVRRVAKSHPLRSRDLEARLGARVQGRTGWQVDLDAPDLWLRVELLGARSLVSSVRMEGRGGLPVGSSGKGLALISGGIDSPVAAQMMMDRGLKLHLVHFHSAPYTSPASQEKVRDLARLLCAYQLTLDLVMFPFADPIQRAVVLKAPEAPRVLLYRRFMMRLAARAAEHYRARCLVTGEALGQVASQTIENLAAVEAVSPLPVLRPLIGMGKAAIIEHARALGSYEVSIQPHEDCCAYLMPHRPATRSTPEELEAAEADLPVDELVDATWEARSFERFRYRDL